MSHKTVLLQEAITALNLHKGSCVFDGTFGAGGHSRLIAAEIGLEGTLIACDRDSSVFETDVAREIGALTKFVPRVANFRDIKHTLAECSVSACDAALLDLGLSSTELEESGRGFSFQKDEPLLMTYEDKPGPDAVTAASVVNGWSESSLADIIYGFGDERYARRIARVIVETRTSRRIKTTGDLVEIIRSATPAVYQRGKTHFATRTFQALRMAVNDELGAIDEGVRGVLDVLTPGGRLVIITFHSTEDRLVKRLFRGASDDGRVSLVVKKPLIPSDAEMKDNPRSRSAKLRIVERCSDER